MIIKNNRKAIRINNVVECKENEKVVRDTNRQHYLLRNVMNNSVDVYKLNHRTGNKSRLYTVKENTLFQTVARIEEIENIVIEMMY